MNTRKTLMRCSEGLAATSLVRYCESALPNTTMKLAAQLCSWCRCIFNAHQADTIFFRILLTVDMSAYLQLAHFRLEYRENLFI